MTADRLLTVAETAILTEVHQATVRGWIRDGLLEVERIGPRTLKRVRVRASVLKRMFPHINLPTASENDGDRQ